jgi:hypothetical protein
MSTKERIAGTNVNEAAAFAGTRPPDELARNFLQALLDQNRQVEATMVAASAIYRLKGASMARKQPRAADETRAPAAVGATRAARGPEAFVRMADALERSASAAQESVAQTEAAVRGVGTNAAEGAGSASQKSLDAARAMAKEVSAKVSEVAARTARKAEAADEEKQGKPADGDAQAPDPKRSKK